MSSGSSPTSGSRTGWAGRTSSWRRPHERPATRARRAASRSGVWLARLVVTVERLWPALWPTLAVAGHFRRRCRCSGCGCSLPLCAAPPLLAAVLAAARLGPCGGHGGPCAWPARDAGLSRLEQDSGVAHQPLRALDDTLPGDFADPATRRLWALHRQRLIASLERLRLAPPRSDLPRRDPWALRAALLLVLVVARGPWPRRDRPAPAQRLQLRRAPGRRRRCRRRSICGSRRRPIPAARRW